MFPNFRNTVLLWFMWWCVLWIIEFINHWLISNEIVHSKLYNTHFKELVDCQFFLPNTYAKSLNEYQFWHLFISVFLLFLFLSLVGFSGFIWGRSYVSKFGLELPTLALNWSSCLNLPSARISGMCHHTWTHLYFLVINGFVVGIF